jgi:hypothetical protein
VKSSALVIAAFLSLPLSAADSVVTLCDTTSLDFTPTWRVRKLGACADGKPNALWHLDRLDSNDGRLDGRYASARVNALVFVIDTGVESDHEEFADGNVIAGIDVSPASGKGCPPANEALHPCPGNPYGVQSHGTGVASMIGGRHVGVAPGVSIVAVRPGYGAEPATMLASLNAIIEYSWNPTSPQVKTAVVNISASLQAGTYPDSEAKIRDMVVGVDKDGKRDPNGKRFLFTASAGNAAAPSKAGADRGQCGPNYEVKIWPASLGTSIAGLIAVGGTDRDNKMWVDSCRGSGVELYAPAADLLAASNTAKDHYRVTDSSGTSWSAPIVAGVAARILSTTPDLTPAELEARLEASPTAISEPADGPSGGRVVHVETAPPPHHRRASSH